MKKKIGKWLSRIGIAVLVVAVAVLALIPDRDSQTDSVTVNSEVKSGTAGTAEIQTALSGAGTLTEDAATAEKIPSVVELVSYHVQNGDTVAEGDILASVDQTSVKAAIVELQSVIDELDEALADEADEDAEDEITAAADGRVIKIYAEEGTAVKDTVGENGALLLVSLDGLMKVTLTAEGEYSVGDEVKVVLSNGKKKKGRVASLGDGTCVVTLSDKNTEYGDEVTVTDSDGNEIGTGTLEINSEWKAVGTAGTVDEICVSEGESVDEGDTLIELSDTGHTDTYATLLNRRHELEDQMEDLYALAEDGYLRADTAGTVSGISDDADYEALEDEENTSEETSESETTEVSESAAGEETSEAETRTTTGYTSSSHTVSTMKYITAGAQVASVTSNNPKDTDDTELINYVATVVSVSGSKLQLLMNTENVKIDDYTDLSAAAKKEMSESRSYDCESNSVYIYKSGSWSQISPSELEAGDLLVMTYSGNDLQWLIAERGAGTLPETTAEETTAEETTTQEAETESLEEETAAEPEQPTETESSAEENPAEPEQPSESESSTEASEPESRPEESSAESEQPTTPETGGAQPTTSETGSAQPTVPGAAADVTVGAAESVVSAESSEAEEAVYETYSIEEQTVLSVTPMEEMELEVSIDERDILSVSSGQEAEITLDAVKGESFTGTVSHISASAENGGGNAKYTVTLLMTRTEDMLAGMNASVKLITGTQNPEITVPAAALVEDGGKTWVYTSYDEKTDTLGDLVEVETGVSDGENVEITSGLSAGDTYSYRYADSVTYTFQR